MKKYAFIDYGLAFLLLCFLVISACVPITRKVGWETLPEFNVSEDQGWNALVDSILVNFDGFTISEKNAGYIKTTWKITDHCWAGTMFGGSVPCKKARASAKVISRTPFKVRIAVEVQKANPWTNFRSWTVVGNDVAMEKEIIDDLQMTLASLAEPPVTAQLSNPDYRKKEPATSVPGTSKIAGRRKTEKVASSQEVIAKEKLAVMDMKAKHGVKESLAEGLSVVVRDTIQGIGDYEVLSKDDVEVVAKRTAIRQSLGCDDTQCLIDIGRSLGSKFMVAGAISKFGDTYNISLRLIDTVGENAGVKDRVNIDCKCAEDELIEAARVAANQLLE